ncbi:hypothetical protein [Gordonia sp. SL306]|uniref:hypothetical protein n=1 Tax=Gordonia sp. SL306 TaxID=2995145 RepID=UPI00226E8924|nr:hypothetical protein [Gordonia sp. SL306]WAC53698.1 hypothetical protein OVA31_13310 [Gordonia sp. SL306]
MTQPPDDRWDPNREHPDTRRFDPADETAAYRPDDRGPADQPPEATGRPGPYGPPQAYTEAAAYGPPYGEPGPGEPPPPPPKNTGRTVGLVIAVIAAVVVLALVGILIARGSGSNDEQTAGASASSATTTTSEAATTTTTTTEETTTTTPTPTVAPGAVVYQLTGNGDVIGIRYINGTRSTVVAAAGAPWSQAATVTGATAELNAIVVRGPVTCNILHGRDLLASSTSNGGPLTCSAPIPAS